MHLRAWTRRRPLATFLALTFAISWGVPAGALAAGAFLPVEASVAGYSPLAYVAVWGPAIAAIAVIGWANGRRGLGAFARRVTRPRGRWPWYAAVAAGIPATYLAAALLSAATGGPAVSVSAGWVGPFVATSLARLTQGPVEEVGWRGVALPLLQRQYSGLVAAVVLGVVWALWHLPALVVSTAQFARGGALGVALVRLFVSLVATSLVLTVAFNGTAGSVPLAVLFHWLTNLAYPWETGTSVPVAQDALTVVVAAVVATLGRRYLGRERLATRVLPADARVEFPPTG